MPTYYFLHVPSNRSWPTDGTPHQWLLDRRDDDLLAPARERLLTSPDDPEPCLRAVLRRCGLVLIRVVTESQVVVRYWSGPAPDVRAWAKQSGWNRPGVQVAFVREKAGKVVVYRDGQDVLLYGERIGPNFPWDIYAAKYERRGVEENDDSGATPASFTNFVWQGSPHERPGWRLLKSIWIAERVECPNCDVPLLLIGFDWRMGMLSFQSARVVRVCLRCRRRSVATEEEPLTWLAGLLPPPLRPVSLQLWQPIPIDWPRLSLGRGRGVQVVGRDG